jgi:hypothetical protein
MFSDRIDHVQVKADNDYCNKCQINRNVQIVQVNARTSNNSLYIMLSVALLDFSERYLRMSSLLTSTVKIMGFEAPLFT